MLFGSRIRNVFGLLMAGLPLATALAQQSLQQTDVSPKKTFKVEQIQDVKGDRVLIHAWIVGAKGERVPFRGYKIPHKGDVHSSDENSIPYEIAISPNERWIFRTQKQFRGEALGFLDERRGPPGSLQYDPAFTLRFDEAAWRFFAYCQRMLSTNVTASPGMLLGDHVDGAAVPNLEHGRRIIDFDHWAPDSSRIYFTLRPVATPSQYWYGYFDARKNYFGATTEEIAAPSKYRSTVP